jgi:hypothetical protein
MKSIKKAGSWRVGVSILTGLYLATLIAAPEVLEAVGGPIVYAIAFATVGYIGGNVADNALKGRFYRPELDQETRCGEKLDR